ncbi:MAG: hypothetical protein MUD10_05160 [Candidatus Pacebacteria bacterium]|jgi:uncharacterized secreted protein with C-terminal beta-propeller domain|nr:hypothetical protein [Candidatus Paceibacterota bacterium]
MISRTKRYKNNDWRKERIDNRFAIGFLSVLAVLTSIYLLASSRHLLLSSPAIVGSPAASDVQTSVPLPEAPKKLPFVQFASEEDFKSYLDDGKRAYGDGVFGNAEKTDQSIVKTEPISNAAAKLQAKTAVKSVKEAPIATAAEDAQKYFSLNANRDGRADILQSGPQQIFFSPENQYYWSGAKKAPVPATFGDTESGQEGKSLVFDSENPEALNITGRLERSGDLLLYGKTIFIFRDNLISAFDVSAASSTAALWEARIDQDSRVAGAKVVGSKLYLLMRTKIDPAHPCPIKPLAFADSPLVLECGNIYHPRRAVLADTIFSVLELDRQTGVLSRDFAFTAAAENSTMAIFGESVYALWGQGGDYTLFFADFLGQKCKGLLPDYLLTKVGQLPGYDISLAAKELELRALLSNWIASLNSGEQKRIMAELAARMADYLRTHYRDFELTGVARADIGTLEFVDEAEVAGRVPGPEFIGANEGKLLVTTISGRDAYKKMNWLVTGETDSESAAAMNSIYLLGEKLAVSASKEGLDLPAGICAIGYAGDYALASLCRPEAQLQILGFSESMIGLQGQLAVADPATYVYPLSDDLVLAVSKNNRKIKLIIYDVTLRAKPELRSEQELNDYWADFDGNTGAFAADDVGRQFFLPVAKGGYVFSYRGAKLELKGLAGSVIASRALFAGEALYLAGDSAIEAVSLKDLKKIKLLAF